MISHVEGDHASVKTCVLTLKNLLCFISSVKKKKQNKTKGCAILCFLSYPKKIFCKIKLQASIFLCRAETLFDTFYFFRDYPFTPKRNHNTNFLSATASFLCGKYSVYNLFCFGTSLHISTVPAPTRTPSLLCLVSLHTIRPSVRTC